MAPEPRWTVTWHGAMGRPNSGTKGELLAPRPRGLVDVIVESTRQAAKRSGPRARRAEWRSRMMLFEHRPPRRVVSRQAIAKSLAGLAIRVVRFGEYRAATPSDHGWVARVGDALRRALDEAARTT